MQPLVLIVAEQPAAAEPIAQALTREGFAHRTVYTVKQVEEGVSQNPAAILFQRSRSASYAEPFLPALRRLASSMAVPLMVLGSGDESDELVAFAMGADDYLAPPISPRLLAARIHALTRRAQNTEANPSVLKSGSVVLDRHRREVRVDGKELALTPTEFTLLRELLAGSGRVVTRQRLCVSAFGSPLPSTDRRLDVHMTGVRKKLGTAAACLQTVRGVGYKWQAGAAPTVSQIKDGTFSARA